MPCVDCDTFIPCAKCAPPPLPPPRDDDDPNWFVSFTQAVLISIMAALTAGASWCSRALYPFYLLRTPLLLAIWPFALLLMLITDKRTDDEAPRSTATTSRVDSKECESMPSETDVKTLHVFRNEVSEWFVAATLDDAVAVAREYLTSIGADESEWDLDLAQEPDDKLLRITTDGLYEMQEMTCAEWAQQNGRGFLCSTEW